MQTVGIQLKQNTGRLYKGREEGRHWRTIMRGDELIKEYAKEKREWMKNLTRKKLGLCTFIPHVSLY